MRTILWTIGVIVGAVMLFAGFTKSCDMISAPSAVRMVSGFVLLGLLVGAVIAAGVQKWNGTLPQVTGSGGMPLVQLQPPSSSTPLSSR